MKTACRVVAALVWLLVVGSPAHAQLFRAYLSVAGSDLNPCTVGAPCRLLPAALNAVANGGQIWILDSANFNAGTVNVTKSVSIQALPGQSASIVAVGGTPAMVINAPGGTVGLRNLTFTDNALNHGAEGLKITNASTVSVEACLFADLNLDSLVAINTSAVVHVVDTTFRNVNGWSVASWNGPTINVTNSRMHHTEGPFVFTTSTNGTSTMSLTDTTISDGHEGILVNANASGAVAQAFLTRVTIYKTLYGLDTFSATGGSSLITVSNSMITKNNNAFIIGSGAVVQTLGNNHIADNLAETGTLTPIAQR